jgi:hypothetical protein
MVQYITLDPQSTIPFNQSVIDDTIDTVKLSSIQRLKKIYDLLVNENIIKVLIEDI